MPSRSGRCCAISDPHPDPRAGRWGAALAALLLGLSGAGFAEDAAPAGGAPGAVDAASSEPGEGAPAAGEATPSAGEQSEPAAAGEAPTRHDPLGGILISAPPTPAGSASLMDPVAITLSGGASLGAYQGGLAYTLIRYLRSHRALVDAQGEPLAEQPFAVPATGRVYRLIAATGTSAGAANATATALLWCAEDQSIGSFRDNLYRELWMPASVEDLLPAAPDSYAPQDGLLSTRALQPGLQALVRHLYNDRVREGCDVPLGFAVTRSTPARLSVGDSLEFSTSQYVATFRMGQGAGGKLRLSRQPLRPGRLIARELLFPTRQGEIDKNHLVKAIRASTAIPSVFAPELLNHCVGPEEQPPGEELPQAPGCPVERPLLRQDTFVDGGIFDRVPIALAVEFADEASASWDWQRRGKLSYVTADPMQARWETLEPPAPSTTSRGLAALMAFTSDFVVVARQTELLALYQQRRLDEEREALVPINRGFPVFGRYVGNFGATMDRGFREYDYLVGMYEALRYLAQRTYGDRLAAGDAPGLPPIQPAGAFDCLSPQIPPHSSPESLACALPYFSAIGQELGLDKDPVATGLMAELLRWDLQRRLPAEEVDAMLVSLGAWPATPSPEWNDSPTRLLLETLRGTDHQGQGSRPGTNLAAFLEVIVTLKSRGYPFENKALERDPEAYLYRLARRALGRLEQLEREEQGDRGGSRTVGQRLALGAIRTATAAVPAPAAPRDTLERKRSGLEVLLPNYLDFNVLHGGADVGYETRVLDWGPVGVVASAEPLAWERTRGLGWQGTVEAGWHNQGFNPVTAIRAGAFVQSRWLDPESAELGLRISGRFLANRVQVGLEAPLWEATVGAPRIEGWPARLELTVGVVDVRGVTRLGGRGWRPPEGP